MLKNQNFKETFQKLYPKIKKNINNKFNHGSNKKYI